MEKLLRPYDKASMRMAMLKHEETFKEQVYELHRIYRIQKKLMKSIGSSRSCNGSFSSKNNHHGNMHQNSRMKLDLECPADHQEYNIAESPDHHDHGNRMFEAIDESEIELTLGPTSYLLPRKKHGTSPRTSDSGPSFSSSSTESSHMNRTCSSSTRQKTKTTEEFSGGRELEFLQVTDMRLGYQNRSKNNVDLEEQLRQERLKHPSWLFQVLSMNMT